MSLSHSIQRVDHLTIGDGDPSPIGAVPVEAVVEQVALELELDYRERVRVGQDFERRLRTLLEAEGTLDGLSTLLDELRRDERYGFPRSPRVPPHELDQATQRFARFMRGRVVDGAAVLAGAVRAPSGSPLDDAALTALQQEVAEWYGNVCARPTPGDRPSWQSEKLSHEFQLSSASSVDEEGTRLVAPQYQNGTVDWYTFSAGSSAGSSWDASPTPLVTTPTRIQVSGNSPRWWAFEDGHTDFGSMDVAKPDLGKLLLMEMALVYGDDWFSVPLPVPLASLVRVDDLHVQNVFGEETKVRPVGPMDADPAGRFELFTISNAESPLAPGLAAESDTGERVPLLLIPPTSGFRQESQPLEEVRFLRDENANMVWGVEHLVPNGLGRPVRGFDAQLERTRRQAERERAGLEELVRTLREQVEDPALPVEERHLRRAALRLAMARLEELDPHVAPTPSQSETPRYRLATTVPANWIPFIPDRPPQPHAAQARVELRRAQMLRPTDHARMVGLGTAEPEPISAMSRLLAMHEDALLWLREEVVPRAGVRVQLTKQRTRWTDGSTHVWLGRKVLTGRGEGASGLRFDAVGGGH
ncbi:MAG: hypothetical protein JJ863_17725 [Deltaproteobacteria bacterium]|nr:hypothetical protein [Deltaproteobacteria bacterium]